VDIVVVDPDADRGHLRRPKTLNSQRAMSRAASLTAIGNRALAEARGQGQGDSGAEGIDQSPKLVTVELSVAPWANGSMRAVRKCFSAVAAIVHVGSSQSLQQAQVWQRRRLTRVVLSCSSPQLLLGGSQQAADQIQMVRSGRDSLAAAGAYMS
jgi:hypothetical protein